MAQVITARILADKVLMKSCGQECVDWAIGMLEKGCDGEQLAMLAGMVPPFSNFEVAARRDRVLEEQGIREPAPSEVINGYAAERLADLLAGKERPEETLAVVKDLCVAHDYSRELHDFYLLYFALVDLMIYHDQHYWPDATEDNIQSIVRESAQKFLRAHPLLM